ERIHREIRAIKQAHPNSLISVIAHSFGTYGIARVLEEYPDIRLRRLVLCGSIVPRAFRWDKLGSRQLEQPVVNDCGERDVWPLFAQSLSFGYGASGTLGFGSANVIDRFHLFTHSQFFRSDFIKSFWVSLF